MEIEAESGGNGGESLLDFFLNGVSDDLFDVRTTSGVEVAAKLSGGEVEGEKKREKKQQEISFVHHSHVFNYFNFTQFLYICIIT